MKKINISDLFEQEDVFKGIRKSAIDTIETLQKVQSELKESAKVIQNDIKNSSTNSAKGLKEFSDAAKAASQVMKDSATIAKQQAQAEQQRIKVDQELIKLEKLKAQELARVSKEQEKAAKLAANESSAYSKLSKELNNARKAYKDLAVTNQENTAEGKQLLATITQLDQQLKKVDATVGQHQRNVGNYEGATKSLKLQLRELTQALQQMDESDPRFQKMAAEAGELRDRIQDTQAVVQATAGTAMENFAGATAKVGQVGVAAFQGLESSMQLLGVENENVLAGMAKLQALAGLSDALQVFGGLGDTLTQISAGFTAAASKLGLYTAATEANTAAQLENEAVGAGGGAKADLATTIASTAATEADTVATMASTAATEADVAVTASSIAVGEADIATTVAGTAATAANTTATVAGTTATNAANVATKSFFTTLLTNPITLVVAAVAALAYGLYKLTEASEDEKIAEEARKQVQEENLQLSQEMNSNIAKETSGFIMLTTQLKNTNVNSKERQKLINQINSQYGTTLKNLSDEAAFQAQVNATVQDYMNMMRNKALLERNVKQHTKAIEDEFNATDTLNEMTIKRAKAQKILNELLKEKNKVEADGGQVLERGLNKKVQGAELNSLDKQIKKNQDLINGYNQRISVAQESVKINKELQESYAKQNQELTNQNNLNKYEIPPPPTIPQQEYNKELEKTVDLTKEIQDEQIKQIKDEEIRAYEETKIAAQRRIEDVKSTNATAEQKAQLIKEIETNLNNDLIKISEDYIKKNREDYEALKEFRKRNAEEIAEKERQENIKLYEDSVAFEDKQNQAKLASLSGNQREEFEERLQFWAELEKLNKLKQDGAFASQEEYEKAVANLKKKYNKTAEKLEEEKWKTTQEFAQKTTDYFKKQSEERISQIDKEIAAAEKQADYYRQLAANGNINAQQSLAEQERIIAESNRRKEREQKRQQRMELANTIYQTYAGHAAKDPETALMKTIKDASLLQAFISTLPMFYDGTEDTGRGGGVDGKGGFHAVLHPHERVIPKSLNDQIGNLTNEQLTRLAMEYNNGRLVGQDVAHSSMDLAIMVNELRDLKDIIKHKPETNIELGEITQSAMEIVKSTRKGNTTVYNRFKVRS